MGRRRTRVEIDLIGFLDIISILIVLVLLVISSLAINLGISNPQSIESPPKDDPIFKMPEVKVITTGGIPVNSPISFLMCDNKYISIFNPQSGKRTRSFLLADQALTRKLLLEINTPRAYLAVKPSCFDKYEKVAAIIEEIGSTVGYEPIKENSATPWSIDISNP